ncbi:MAG: hypothetical protein KDD44_15360, partial [Bdellovibrionales bacterium]|nr:hypothetical protein [Bdellovibrionales bacterium]
MRAVVAPWFCLLFCYVLLPICPAQADRLVPIDLTRHGIYVEHVNQVAGNFTESLNATYYLDGVVGVESKPLMTLLVLARSTPFVLPGLKLNALQSLCTAHLPAYEAFFASAAPPSRRLASDGTVHGTLSSCALFEEKASLLKFVTPLAEHTLATMDADGRRLLGLWRRGLRDALQRNEAAIYGIYPELRSSNIVSAVANVSDYDV